MVQSTIELTVHVTVEHWNGTPVPEVTHVDVTTEHGEVVEQTIVDQSTITEGLPI